MDEGSGVLGRYRERRLGLSVLPGQEVGCSFARLSGAGPRDAKTATPNAPRGPPPVPGTGPRHPGSALGELQTSGGGQAGLSRTLGISRSVFFWEPAYLGAIFAIRTSAASQSASGKDVARTRSRRWPTSTRT